MEGKRLKLDKQPIARRTRLKEAQYFKECYERRREEDGKNVAKPSGWSEDRGVNGGKLGRVGRKCINMETRDLGLNCRESASLENRVRREKTGEKVTDENEDRDVVFLCEKDAKECGDLGPEKCRDVIVIDDDDNDDEGVIFICENLGKSTRSNVIRDVRSLEGSESPVSGKSSEHTDVGDAADAPLDDHGGIIDKNSGLNVISRSCNRLEGCRCSLCIEQRVERIKDTGAIAAAASGDDDDCDENHDDEVDDGDVVWEKDMDELDTSEEDNDDSDDEDYTAKKTRKRKYKPRTHDVNGRDVSNLEGSKQSSAATFDHDDCDDDDCIWKHDLDDLVTSCEEDKGDSHNKVAVRKTMSRKGKHMPKSHDIVKVVVNSILEEEELLFEETISSDDVLNEQGNYPETEPVLPLKFTFGIDESSMSKKSDSDNELHNLWAEMNFAQRSCEIDSDASNMVENEDAVFSEVDLDIATLCSKGSHHLILDEEIGVKCKYCCFIQQEIKYILPPFDTFSWKKQDKRDGGTDGKSIFGDLDCQDSFCNFQSDIDLYTIKQGTVWDMIPGVKNSMYPHQREGFEFIWNNIAGGIVLDKLKDPARFDGGNGCIISHAPGTGKTRLTIVFLQTYMMLYPRCKPVIVAPRSMLLTWEEEFIKWKVGIPFHNLNKSEFSGDENQKVLNYLSQARKGVRSTNAIRMVKLYSWKKDGGVLGVSYRLFEELTGEEKRVKRKARKIKVLRKAKDEKVRKILLELPGIFIFDEGHTPRNDQTYMWKALSNIKTQKRIILSGTPFQNNFDELFNTLCLVMPKFGDTISPGDEKDHKRHVRKRNEAKGKWASLTSSLGKFLDVKADNLKVIRDVIGPFVHVHKGKILKDSLPGLRHSVVVLRPVHLQKSLLDSLQGTRNMILLDFRVSLVSVHPSLLIDCCPEMDNGDIDWKKVEKCRMIPDAGVKTKFVNELLHFSEAMGEKVLIFAQYLEPLTLIMDQIRDKRKWTQGKEVLYMDGQYDIRHRQALINAFNNSSEVKVLLASTRACSEGINLSGASRVILIDVAWNPSVERQAISRAYRLGQKKFVHVYHLITSGTMEEDKFQRQSDKSRMSELVFSSNEIGGELQKVASICEDKILEEMMQHNKLKDMFEKIYQKNESDLFDTFDLVAQ